MKRNKNKKIVLASTIVLGIAAITSSALAAYIITGGATNGTADVQKPTGIEVENNIVDLQVGEVSGQLLFYPEATISDGIVTSDVVGKLTIELPLSIEAGSKSLIDGKTIKLTVTEKERGTLVSGNYVTVPATQEIKGSSLTDDNKDNVYEKTVTLKWGWGTTFGSENGSKDPATYCNEEITGGRMTASQAKDLLEDFQTAVAGCPGFTISIDLVDAQPGA